jgi:hypothetical protein
LLNIQHLFQIKNILIFSYNINQKPQPKIRGGADQLKFYSLFAGQNPAGHLFKLVFKNNACFFWQWIYNIFIEKDRLILR